MNNTMTKTAVSFDATNENWQPQREYNLLFLRATQNHLNDLLRVRGHVLVNDVLDLLGCARTAIGAIVGWTNDNEDAHIDFGIWGPDPINEAENGIILELNTQGVVYNGIERKPGGTITKQVRGHVSYPMLGDGITGLQWCQTRLYNAIDEGLITKWEFVSANDNPSGIITVRFLFTAVVEYPVTVAPEEQDEVILMTLQPLVNQIVRDTDATVDWFRLFDI